MDIKTVAVHYERKFNLGDYNSATVGVNLWADLDLEEDDVQECLSELWLMAKENVKEQAMPLIGKDKANQTAPKIQQPVDTFPDVVDPGWTEPPPSQAHAEAQAQAVPVMGKDWGLVDRKPKASDLGFGDRYEIRVSQYKATPAEIKFYYSDQAEYPSLTHNMANDHPRGVFMKLFGGWMPDEDDQRHPIPKGDVILAVQCTDASKQTRAGNPYQNLDGMRRP